MHLIHNRQHPQWQLVLFCSMLVLIFMLAACGSKVGTTGGGGGQTPTPTTPPTSGPVKGYGTSVGCPSDMVVNNAPTQANVLIQLTNMDSTVTAHVGDIIEVRLPFGHKWGGPEPLCTGCNSSRPPVTPGRLTTSASGVSWRREREQRSCFSRASHSANPERCAPCTSPPSRLLSWSGRDPLQRVRFIARSCPHLAFRVASLRQNRRFLFSRAGEASLYVVLAVLRGQAINQAPTTSRGVRGQVINRDAIMEISY